MTSCSPAVSSPIACNILSIVIPHSACLRRTLQQYSFQGQHLQFSRNDMFKKGRVPCLPLGMSLILVTIHAMHLWTAPTSEVWSDSERASPPTKLGIIFLGVNHHLRSYTLTPPRHVRSRATARAPPQRTEPVSTTTTCSQSALAVVEPEHPACQQACMVSPC